MSDAVLYEKRGSVAVITLNQPKTMNSLCSAIWNGWIDGIEKANADDEIGAMVFTGTGKAFCAGGDMNEGFLPKLRGDEPYEGTDHRLGGLGMPWDWLRILRDSKPTVAAVNGLAIGGGATSILPCDIIVAAEEASFHYMFVKLGIVPELGSSHYLAKRVGFTKASEIVLTANPVSASEALDIGLVNAVAPQESLLDKALEYANAMAANPGPMVKLTKKLLTENTAETDVDMIWRRESDALRECFTMPEHREAVTAFLEKRAPDFAAARAAAAAKDS